MQDKEVHFRKQQGNLLKKARKQINLSQEEVAAHFGISQDCISKYERGLATVNTFKLKEFSKLYEKPITFFFMDSPSR
jgi:transcriptional regulator with XRE-family HTH domain